MHLMLVGLKARVIYDWSSEWLSEKCTVNYMVLGGHKLAFSQTILIERWYNSGLYMCFLYPRMCELTVFSQSIDKEQYLVLSNSYYHFETHTVTVALRTFLCVWKWHNTNLIPLYCLYSD